MREYEFRGQGVDDGEWHYGFYREFTMSDCFKDEAYRDGVNFFIDAKGIKDTHLVIPDTVGQYIGITDIYGKKVFEGDIVKTKTTIYNNCSREQVEEVREFTGDVIWHQYGWHVARKTKSGTRYYDLFLWNIEGEEDDTMEIIGNRWDNPEMAVIE